MSATRRFRTRRAIATLLALAAVVAAPSAAEPGFLGIGISIDGEGFVANRIVKAVKVERVVQHSPAARAGIVLGDELVEVDGRTVRGSRVSELRPLLDRPAGHVLRLVVKRPSGQLVEVRVVLAARPPE
jgi:C-terminal processing protease CtpA/Prc